MKLPASRPLLPERNLEHRPPDHGRLLAKDELRGGADVRAFEFGEEPDAPVVYADQRDLHGGSTLCGAQHTAVSAEDDQAVYLVRLLRVGKNCDVCPRFADAPRQGVHIRLRDLIGIVINGDLHPVHPSYYTIFIA